MSDGFCSYDELDVEFEILRLLYETYSQRILNNYEGRLRLLPGMGSPDEAGTNFLAKYDIVGCSSCPECTGQDEHNGTVGGRPCGLHTLRTCTQHLLLQY